MSIILNARTILGFEQTPEALIQLLQEWGTIATTMICEICSAQKLLKTEASSSDGYVWRCANSNFRNGNKKRIGCYKRVSLRKNTFFEHSHLYFSQILLFVRYWVTFTSIENIAIEVDLTKSTVSDWNSYCQEVVVYHCFRIVRPIGGPGIVVDLDEHNFESNKHITGETVDQWFCGGIEQESGDFFFCPIEKRDRTTLVEIVEKWIRPGTTVKLHCWHTDDILLAEDYEELSEKHSIVFLDPRNGSKGDPQKVKVLFANSRSTMPKKRLNVAGFLARFAFVRQCKRLKLDPTVEFMKTAGQLYRSGKPITVNENEDATQNEENQEIDQNTSN